MASVLHSHDGYEIYLFLSGEVRINFENSSYIMKHGDMVLISPYVFHYSMPLGDSTYNRIVINIKESYMQKNGPTYAHFTDCFYHSDSSRLESRQTPPPAITATFRYIDDHLSESLLLEDIAKQVHLNPVYLTRIFKSYTGMPIQQYIIEKRITQAKKLLRMGNPPIDVCFLCGFNNYSNFSRTFSKHLKLSPKQHQISTRASFSTRSSSEQM